MIAPGSWLGVIGGGQLGRFFCGAARGLGYRVAVLDPDPTCPAAPVADLYLEAAYDDDAALREFGQRCAAVTVEFEGVPAASLELLAAHCKVTPGPAALAATQDRIVEKVLLSRIAGVAPHIPVYSRADLVRAPDFPYPGILKAARFGYDGKGQARVDSPAEALHAFARLGEVACVLEQRLSFERELSVVLARSRGCRTAVFPVVENIHRDGILDTSIAPAEIPASVAAAAERAAVAVADALDYQGVMAVEFFLLPDGRLLANEIAPRPHNSGHYTIDSCPASQFEQQVRVLAGLPLGPTAPGAPAVMVNLLGELWADGEPDWSSIESVPGARLHLYGKNVPRPGRKMGHYTCLGETIDQALHRALEIRRALTARPHRHPSPRVEPGPCEYQSEAARQFTLRRPNRMGRPASKDPTASLPIRPRATGAA